MQPSSETNQASDSARAISLQPNLGRAAQLAFRRFARALIKGKSNNEFLSLREQFLRNARTQIRNNQGLRVAIAVLYDLRVQGWTLGITRNKIWARPPEPIHDSPEAEKNRLRESHLHERNNQLRQPSVRDFVRRMERQRRGPNGWVSIFSLMRDGRDLAEKLQTVASVRMHPHRPLILEPAFLRTSKSSRAERTARSRDCSLAIFGGISVTRGQHHITALLVARSGFSSETEQQKTIPLSELQQLGMR